MSDEEEDYMSDKFLSGVADVRPSLIQDRAKKRQLNIVDKQTDNLKKQRQEKLDRSGTVCNKQLQESLNRPIKEDNKGFQLLTKMGFKPGQTLGKQSNETDQTKLREPIGISIKADRGGLGREAALLELANKRRQLYEQRLRKFTDDDVLTTEEFRKRATLKAQERFIHGALRRCQLSCMTLDTQFNLKNPELAWFWPESNAFEDVEKESSGETEKDNRLHLEASADSDDEQEDSIDYTESEKLDMLTNYLRTSYTFCFWCGVRYKNQADLDSNCPGLTQEDH